MSTNESVVRNKPISPWTLTTRRIVFAALFGAMTFALGAPPALIGFIRLPNISGAATILHIPVIIGAVVGGPVVGMLSGFIFGISSILNDTTGLFGNPIISVLPRVLIGLTSWLAYRGLCNVNVSSLVAAAVAGVVGTLTNTILVVGFLVIFGLIPLAVVPTILPQAIIEVIIAAAILPVVVRAVEVVLARYARGD
ncbi:MAG: ECF transporter S component [Chloroflexi bacterium]|nr:ECF transporter S component [Chloroflexota bacterium]MCL5275825.1 ECF transporter S component [Chloroflexota bacterium]